MNLLKISQRTGFTLLEIMLVLVIVIMIGSALTMSMSSGRKTWASADTQISIQQDLRQAMMQITKDLRDSGEHHISCPPDGNPCTSVSFNVPEGFSVGNETGSIVWSDDITYSISSGQIIRHNGTDTLVLANNVTAMTFVRDPTIPSRMVKITLSAQRETIFGNLLNATLVSAVQLRN